MMQLLNPAVIGLLMLFLSVLWMLRDESDRSRPILVIAVTFNLFYGCLLNVLMGQADGLLPWKYDCQLSRIDTALGVSAASVALAFRGGWSVWLNIVYELLLPMMIVWLAVHRKYDCRALILAYVSEMIVGPMLYMILPACGPVYAFGASWLHPPAVHADAIRLSGMPNAFPSLHAATAFVLLFFARDRKCRAISVAFMAGTALATLTTGEHYVIDLIAGLSFGCFASAMGRHKIAQAAAYLAITVCWSLAIRFAGNVLVSHAGLLQSSALFTLVISIRSVWSEWRATFPFPVPRKPALPGVT
jgi:hypothetical protein